MRNLKNLKVLKLLITATLLSLTAVVFLGILSIKSEAQTDNWQIHLNNAADKPAYWNLDDYDPYNYYGGSNIKLPLKTLSIVDSTAAILTYTFNPDESGFALPKKIVPANSYQQIVRITNNSSYPVKLSYMGGKITGSIAPYLEQWISGATTLDAGNVSPYGNSPAVLQTPAPGFFSTGITLQPGESTPAFGAAFGISWYTGNEAQGTSGDVFWSWRLDFQIPSTVTVHYIDESDKALQEETVLTGSTGGKYSTTAAVIAGYELIEDQLPENAAGNYTEGNIDVIYRYKQKIGSVTIHYVDESGNTLKESQLTSGTVGSSYTTDFIDITGYDLDETKLPENTRGNYCSGNIDVFYVYCKEKTETIVVTTPSDSNPPEPSEPIESKPGDTSASPRENVIIPGSSAVNKTDKPSQLPKTSDDDKEEVALLAAAGIGLILIHLIGRVLFQKRKS
ncbi:MucBP domain-containing protein [Lactovum odontotermitis]